MNQYKNRGVLLGKRPTDYIGGVLPYIVNNESGDWTPHSPTPEKQYGKGGDRYNCVTQSGQNDIKMILQEQIDNKKMCVDDIDWLNKKKFIDQFGKLEFSVRFNSITNGTIPGVGNYQYVVADDLRKTGLIPESMLPDDNDISSAEYYDKSKLTPEMYALGQEFLTRFKINYEWVEPNIDNLIYQLKQSPLQIIINQGTHAVAEILQTKDIRRELDSYPPYQNDKPASTEYQFSLKYVVTYLTNPINNNMYKLIASSNPNYPEVFAVKPSGEVKQVGDYTTLLEGNGIEWDMTQKQTVDDATYLGFKKDKAGLILITKST